MKVRPFRIDEQLDRRVNEYLAKTPNIDYSKFARQAILELLERKEKENVEHSSDTSDRQQHGAGV